MNDIIRKTFGGLKISYYLRHLLFGLIIFAAFTAITLQSGSDAKQIIFFAISTVLYPYSRFVYETAVVFILGNTVLFTKPAVFIIVKSISMIVCWVFAVLIAPIGLVGLYIYFSTKGNRA